MSSETFKLFKESWKFIVPYWKSAEKYKALGILVLILLLTLATIGISVRLTYWTQAFYTALEKHDYARFVKQIQVFFLLIAMIIPVTLGNSLLISFLSFSWRKWVTDRFLYNWTHNNTYYHVMLHKEKVDNPDQRISQDLDLLSSLSLSLFLSFFREIITLFSFGFILWTISSTIPLKMFGHTFKVQGYLLWAAFLYSMLGTIIVVKVGQPLINLNFMQQHYEANFRYSLIRLQEKREEIAVFGGIKPEIKNLKDAFGYIKDNYYTIIRRNLYIGLCYSSFINISQIIPIIAAAPMYFAGIITLGVVMQVLRAFEEVRDSFSLIATNFNTIAEWRASTKRLLELVEHIDLAENKIKNNAIHFKRSKDSISFKKLNLYKPDSKPILRNIDFSVNKGNKTLLMGRSGSGKSTIIRALRGLWTYGNGNIEMPKSIFYVPQRPYMPISTLKEAMIYPLLSSDHKSDDKYLISLLRLFKLEHLVEYLDEKNDWSTILSLGEQQRISFIRILVNKPSWLVMDEPTSSLDPKLEKLLFETLLNTLKTVTLVTVGHSESLRKFHEKIIDVEQWKDVQ